MQIVMKRVVFVLILLLAGCLFASAQTKSDQTKLELDSLKVHFLYRISEHTAPGYKLYPTENMWTFLQLETFSGRVWQVQYSINDDSSRVRVVINDIDLADAEDDTDEDEFAGRFELYPTKNMYTFLLLDTKTGYIYQIQWSSDSQRRGLVDVIH